MSHRLKIFLLVRIFDDFLISIHQIEIKENVFPSRYYFVKCLSKFHLERTEKKLQLSRVPRTVITFAE